MVSSVARCWASLALPPLPKKRILPPPRMQETQASSMRRKAGPRAARVAAATAICSSNSLSNRLIAAVLHYSGESPVEHPPVGLLADAMTLVVEGEDVIGNARALQGPAHYRQILRRHIRIAHALHDQQPASDPVDEMDG